MNCWMDVCFEMWQKLLSWNVAFRQQLFYSTTSIVWCTSCIKLTLVWLYANTQLFIASLPLDFLPPVLSLSYICISTKQTGVCGVKCVSCTGLTCPFSSVCLNFFGLFSLSLPLSFRLSLAFHSCFTFAVSHSLCLCSPLLICFAVDLTAVINDLNAWGRQRERDALPLQIFVLYVTQSYIHTDCGLLGEIYLKWVV